MSKIRTISSESDLKKEASRVFQYNLEIDQKSFYFEEGSEKFYDKIPKEVIKNDTDAIYRFGNEIKKKCYSKDEKISFISLGCGEGEIEKPYLEKLQAENYNLKYYGVDSSMAMIERAIEKYDDSKIDSQFISADFSSQQFKDDHNDIIDKNSKKIFAFLGGTIGNVPQHYIANALRNTLNKNDLLWIGAQADEKLTNTIANKYFKKYLARLNDKKYIDFLHYPLKQQNIPTKNGKIILEMEKDKSINTLIFKYGFQVTHEIDFEKNNEKTTLLEGDIINLITIRVYELESLIKFFERRDFKLIKYIIEDNDLQIAFEKL